MDGRSPVKPEPAYEVLALFTASSLVSGMLVVAVGTLLPYVALAYPEHRDHLSLLVTALMFGGMMTTIAGSAATDRFGDKALLIACGGVMGLSLIAASLIHSFVWLLVWFGIYGIGFAAVNAVGSHAILYFFKPERRGIAMGVRQTGFPIGGVIGALLFSALSEAFGYQAALFAGGVLLLAVAWGCAALYRQPAELSGTRVRPIIMFEDVARVATNRRLLLITASTVLVFAPQVALMGFLPLTLLRQTHISAALASVVFVVAQFAAILGRLMWGWASDRFFHGDRMLPMALNCVMCAAGCFGIAFIAHANAAELASAALVLGFTAEGWNGLSIVAMAEVGGEKHAGAALGAGLTLVWAAGVVFPPIFQGMFGHIGTNGAWEVTAVLSVLGAIPALMSRRRRPA